MRSAPLALAAALLLAAPLTAQQSLIHALDGDSGGDRLGWTVGSAGDMDGDGVPDLAAGAPRDDDNGTSSGSARVWSGATGAVLGTWFGDNTSDQFGSALAGAGDVNGDGFDDIVVGAPYDDDNGASCGMARVISGNGGGVLWSVYGDAADDELGSSVASAGDVDGDGLPDVIVGAVQQSGNGYARIYKGNNGNLIRTLLGSEFQSQFGISVSALGDLDGDGRSEQAVGAWLDDTPGLSSGRAFVFDGASGSLLKTLSGPAAHDWFGYTVAGPGDLDGDGVPDLVVGAYGSDLASSDGGAVFAFTGSDWLLLWSVGADEPGVQLGFSLSAAGDTNGDGLPDVLAGAPFSSTGRAHVFSGPNGNLLHTLQGQGAGDVFARGVAGVGDVNGDGHSDLLVGAPLDDDNGTSAGRVTLWSGFQPWKLLGGGVAGTHGVPLLTPSGTLIGGSPAALDVSGALENSSAALVVGLSALNAPFKGGLLVPNPEIVIFGLPVNGAGALSVPTVWPLGLPSGISAWEQFWIADAGAAKGWAATIGVSSTTP